MNVFYLRRALYLLPMKKSKYIRNREQDISDIRHYVLLFASKIRRSYWIFIHRRVHFTQKKLRRRRNKYGYKIFWVFFCRNIFNLVVITFQKSQCTNIGYMDRFFRKNRKFRFGPINFQYSHINWIPLIADTLL